MLLKRFDRKSTILKLTTNNVRLINVTGAGYADCEGLYSISNMTSIWDNKRMVYERVAGGWRPMDKRWGSKLPFYLFSQTK